MLTRTRFAPSPSGHLHVGGARTALFCWAFARSKGGKFVLRIEDTDQKRSSDAASMAFLADLKWLGIEWDEGPEFEGLGGGEAAPYFQSQRLEIYNRYLDRLIAEGKAYRAFESGEELDAEREAAKRAGRTWKYSRAGARLDRAAVDRLLAEGRPCVVRLKVPENRDVVVQDRVLGEVRVNTAELDDFVLRKADGFPTYHFAVVVDDELMGVTHVIRAQEHLYNTPRHVLIQEALGFRLPEYAHLSLIFNPDNSKMSKRDKDKLLRRVARERKLTGARSVPLGTWAAWQGDDAMQLDFEVALKLAEELGVALPEINVDDFRRAGYLPEVLVNYLALLGWSPGGDVEKFGRDFLVKNFSLERVIKSPARFDRDKLLAFNLDAIQAMSSEEFAQRLSEHARAFRPEYLRTLGAERFALFAACNQARSKTLDDPFRGAAFFISADEAIAMEDSPGVRKAMAGTPSGFDHLRALRSGLASLSAWTGPAIEAEIRRYADAHAEGKLGKVAQPLRVAVTGSTVSPSIHDTLAILGRDSVLRRIDRCVAAEAGAAARV